MVQKAFKKSRNLRETMRYPGKWIACVDVDYEDESGEVRQWEYVHRKNLAEAAVIVAQMVPSGRYILIKEFRPPTNAYVLEFPAGLIDPDETPEETAIRELKEETGYTGRVLYRTPRLYASPGIVSEACYLVFMEVDETSGMNQLPQQEEEPGEFIEVFLKHPEEIVSFVEQETEAGAVLDLKLYSFFHDLFFQPA